MEKRILLRNVVRMFLFGFVCTSLVYGENAKVGTTTATFLKMGLGARPAAMGGAFVAISDDINATYWNPAGLCQILSVEINATYIHWFEDIKNTFVGYCLPLRENRAAIGASCNYLRIESIDGRDEWGESTGEKTVWNLALPITYSSKLNEKLFLGSNLKLISQDYVAAKGNGIAVDLGLLFNPLSFLSLGLNFQNMGPKTKIGDKEELLPFNIKSGIAYRDNVCAIGLDLDNPVDDNVKIHLGSEYWIKEMVALRAGYEDVGNLGEASGLTLGLGFKYDTSQWAWFGELEGERRILVIDYALASYGDFGYTHRFSIGIR